MSESSRVVSRISALALIVLVAALAVAGCGGGGSSGGSGGGGGTGGGEAPADEAAIKDGGVLTFALESQPSTLNPSEVIEASSLIPVLEFGEGLYEWGPGGKPVPNLATAVKTSPDGLTWTFTLQKGVKFSDGRPLSSKDVVFSIEQAKKSPFYGSLYEAITAVTAPSPDTVVIKVKTTTPALPAQLAFYTAFIVPDNYAGMSKTAFAQAPVGTGPYEIASAKQGGDITMVQNQEFWKTGEAPHLEELVFSVTTDENSRFQQIRGGELDMTKATAISAKTGVVPGTGVRVEETPQNITDYLLLNQNEPLFGNKKVRQAVNLAVDREGIIQTATDGKGTLGASFLNPAVTYSIQVEPPKRDVAKAKELIAEAAKEGVDTGESFTIQSYNFDAYSGIATQIVQQDLEEVGLSVKLQPLDEAALNELLEAGEYQAVLGLFLPGIADPSELSTFYVDFYAPGNGADVAAQTKVIEEGAKEMDEAKREALYAKLQEMVIAEESMLVLNYQPVVYPVKEEITGVEFDPVGNLILHNAGFAE